MKLASLNLAVQDVSSSLLVEAVTWWGDRSIVLAPGGKKLTLMI